MVAQGCFAAAAPLPAAAEPSPAACASVADLPAELEDAFAFELRSPEILHFISGLAALPAADRKGVFDAALAAAATPQERDAEAVIAGTCPTLDAAYGQARAKFIVVNQWRLPEFADEKRFADFAEVMDTAVLALGAGDAVSGDVRHAALRPFEDAVPAEPPPLPAAAGGCALPDSRARAIVVVTPRYPALAASAATTGTVTVKISLTDTGDVRSAKLYRETVGDRPGTAEIIRASIFAAAASTYAPEVTKCRPIGGLYLFKIDYKPA